ncbi:MerR family transcriptional regulator [Erysipelothrix sp. HDW6A]|uniref:MerR family transcriptional regulator n=1 Tax=Erysipelothrix sp. HDW6A TaxID=2714928 RepID=UPI001407C2C6|nr:MerR family transcriptional regulator [Erysipelothrix sp. HDW6A]QIK56738.1 MerR family transcriptional regulator [Erysipelothrix sp. HDW6A]
MKKTFTIQEIANLYNIGIDSIRYYEKKGLISPERGENGYRYYSLDDISRLNIIRDLLSLSFSTDQIKDYLSDFRLDHTIEIMDHEISHIEKELLNLKNKKVSLVNRIKHINTYRNVETDTIKHIQMPRRQCKEIETRINNDAETDLVVKLLHRDNIKNVVSIGDLDTGAIPVLEHHKVVANAFQSVFLIDNSDDKYDFILEEGDYLSIFYRGSYSQSKSYFTFIRDYALANNYTFSNPPFELYHIDNRYTDVEDEYITEVQLHVIK